MNLFFEENLKTIEIQFPHLYADLQNCEYDTLKVEICQSKTGLPVPRIQKDSKKIFLNSIYDPELDAKRWMDKLSGEERNGLLVIGAGFLYHLKALLRDQRNKFKRIAIYEPSLEVLRACLQEINLKEVIGDFECLIVSGYKQLDKNLLLIGNFMGGVIANLKVETLPSYLEVFHEEITDFQKKLREMVRVSHVNLATVDTYGKNWTLSGFRALKEIIKTPGVRHFFNQFDGIPAVCVAAGPSLEKNIQLLPEIREKAVIICAGSSIRAMIKNNIYPHFLLTFDDGEINCEIYNDPRLRDVHLVYNYRLYYEVIKKYPGPKIYMKLDVEDFSDLISYKSGGYQFGTVLSGFSIAHSTLDFAFRLGCNPVILIGQDLAYSKNKRYADGQLTSLQQQFEGGELPSGGFIVKDVNGEDVVTDHVFESFRILFENRVANVYTEKVKLINATEGGMPIKGIENQVLSEVVKNYCLTEHGITRKIGKLFQQGKSAVSKHGSKALCISWQIDELMEKSVNKMTELIDRLQGLRRKNFARETFEAREKELINITDEYHQVLHYKEYDILLQEFKVSKMSANFSKIYDLGETNDPEKYDQVLKYWLNIINETKTYLEHIREANKG